MSCGDTASKRTYHSDVNTSSAVSTNMAVARNNRLQACLALGLMAVNHWRPGITRVFLLSFEADEKASYE